MNCGIYKIESPSGKVYIGQSRDLKRREIMYRNLHCKKQKKLYSSLNKHGWNAHSFYLLHELPSDVDQKIMNDYEQFYMDQYRQGGIELLNIKEGGSTGCHSEETKIRLRNFNLGRIGHKHTDDAKMRISKAMTGRVLSEETKRKIGDKRKGKTVSEEVKKRMREKATGRPNLKNAGKTFSIEHRQKMSEARKGKKLLFKRKKLSDEHRKQMSERQKGRIPWNKGLKKLAA